MSSSSNRRRLTQRLVDATRPRPGERIELWDTVTPGLGVRCYEHRASFVLRWKPRGGKRVFETIGDARSMRLDEARQEAARRRQQGPRAKSVTVAALLDYYEANHRTRRKRRAPSDDRDTVRRCKLLRERWAGRRADDVTHVDVAAVLAEITARGAPYEANRTRALIRTIWTLARRWGFVPASMLNPADGTPVNRERQRDVQALKAAELTRLLEAASRDPNPWAAGAIRLLALTGCRVGEVLGLRWSDVDTKGRGMILRDRKGGDTLALPLSQDAAATLDALPRHAGSPWVFPGKDPARHLADLRRPWARALRDAGLPSSTRLHDVRAAVATNVADAAGLKVAKLVLGHADERTTMRYVRPAADDVRQAVEAHARALSRPRAKG